MRIKLMALGILAVICTWLISACTHDEGDVAETDGIVEITNAHISRTADGFMVTGEVDGAITSIAATSVEGPGVESLFAADKSTNATDTCYICRCRPGVGCACVPIDCR
jgi:hypothetical protein